uniref:Uncharacterized protein n=1 Tax=Oryza sativa subsp. japonica TaxID=39947 RepID=Q6YX72_ORYSJ|nr:hypothetical protein [Oryza sativa Japonica Group]
MLHSENATVGVLSAGRAVGSCYFALAGTKLVVNNFNLPFTYIVILAKHYFVRSLFQLFLMLPHFFFGIHKRLLENLLLLIEPIDLVHSLALAKFELVKPKGTMMMVCGPKEALGLMAAKGVHMARYHITMAGIFFFVCTNESGSTTPVSEDLLPIVSFYYDHRIIYKRIDTVVAFTQEYARHYDLPEHERLQRTDMVVTTCRLPLRVVVLMVSAVMAGHTGWRSWLPVDGRYRSVSTVNITEIEENK